MSSAIASIHKILKDKTRRKIVLLLHEKGSLSYTELLNELGIDSTGKLNYHLKVLDDLLAKGTDGCYVLTEKGKVAVQLLTDFPEANRQHLGLKPKWWRRFWIGTLAVTVVVFSVFTVAYLWGDISSSTLYQDVISFIFIIGFSYMIQHILRDVISRKMQLAIAKTVYIGGGFVIGIIAAFIGGGFVLVGVSRILGEAFAPGNPFYSLFWSVWYLIFALLAAPTMGAIAMYHFGKKRRFRTQNYNPDLDT